MKKRKEKPKPKQEPQPESDYAGAAADCVDCGESFFADSFSGQGPRCKKCFKKLKAAAEYIEWETGGDTFKMFADGYSGQSLSMDLAVKVFQHENFTFVVTGVWGDDEIRGHIVEPANIHEGPLLKYNELSEHNGSGGLHHGNNHWFTCRGYEWVCVPNKFVRVKNVGETSEQLSMF